MIPARLLSILTIALLASCSRIDNNESEQTRRIVSLDFCADQYLLGLADAEQIAGLSPDAAKSFSYYRDRAGAFETIRPRAEDILLTRPDAVIRTYGGGPNITRFLERVGVRVIQIDYAVDLASVKANAQTTAAALGQANRGETIAAEMDRRLAALQATGALGGETLYLTSKGAVAGRGGVIDELIVRAGRSNFQQTDGWGFLDLERLAYRKPDVIAAGFFDGPDAATDKWSPTRHPVAKRALENARVVNIPGAWTACSAWFVLDAAEAIAAPEEEA